MGNIFLDNCKNEEEKKLLLVLFDKIEKLHQDIDIIDYDTYNSRYHSALEIVSEIALKHRSYYLFNFFGLEAKAERIYGKKNSLKLVIPIGDKKDGLFDRILSKSKKWFHSLTG